MTIGLMAGMLMPALFLCIRQRKREKDKRIMGVIWLCIWPLAGIFGALCCYGADRPDELYQRMCDYEEQSLSLQVQVEGTVSRVEEKAQNWIYLKDSSVLQMTENKAEEDPAAEIIKTDTAVYKGEGVIALYAGELPMIGSRICLEGELVLFSQATNPGVFDQREYYHNLGYDFCLYAQQWQSCGTGYDRISQLLFEFRCTVREQLKALCSKEDYGIFCAVLLGDSQELTDEQKELFQDQGIVHILSVSGLHISAVGMLVFGLLMRLTGSYGVAGGIGSLFVLAYGIMTGNAVSTVRAAVMYVILVLGKQRGRIYDMPSAAACAAILLLFWNPLAVFLPSMQLSFGAVFGLSMTAEIFTGLAPGAGKRSRAFLSVMGLQITMLPIILWTYFQYPAYSLIINQLVLPFAGVLLAAPAIGYTFSLVSIKAAAPALKAGHVIICYYNLLCRFFEMLPGSVQHTGRPALWRIALYYLSLMLLSGVSRRKVLLCRKVHEAPGLKKAKRQRLFALLLACGYLFSGCLFLKADRPTELTVTMLDVGQGDGILLELPDRTVILSDGGSSSQSRLAEYVLEPVLLAKGIDRLDYVMISHGDSDHTNGIIQLMQDQEIAVGALLLPESQDTQEQFGELLEAASLFQTPVAWLSKGDSFSIGDSVFDILAPDRSMTSEDTNELSMVWRLSYGSFSMLFTGDLPDTGEYVLGRLAPVTVLKVAHHGSRYATTAQLLSQLNPRAALISYGRNNSYGHPAQETLDRLFEVGAETYLTGRDGAITIQTDGTKVKISTFR